MIRNIFLGSNGKLIKTNKIDDNLPNIFGNPSLDKFLKFKEILDRSKIKFENIKNLYFFKSNRWDIELNNEILLKLPNYKIDLALENSYQIMNSKKFNKIKIIDLRVPNQIITNE